MDDLREQLIYSTVRIESIQKNGEIGTGTGFFFKFKENGSQSISAIVTNKHVIKRAVRGKFILSKADENNNRITTEHITCEFDNFEKRWILHPEKEIDLCIMPITPILQEATKRKKKLFIIPLDKSFIPSAKQLENLRAIEDITMIGYPNGLWDRVNNLPIVRKGVAATHPNVNYNGKPEFIIDVASFPGSSGSPVFIYNENMTRLLLIGVFYAGLLATTKGKIHIADIPISQGKVVLSKIPMNLGLVVKSEKLLDFNDLLSDQKSHLFVS